MVSILELRRIARGRLRDAEVLLAAGRYDGAIYLCGYAIETAPKVRICRTLKWPGYPSTRREFEGFQSFRTHDLDILLHLSGIENKIRTTTLMHGTLLLIGTPTFGMPKEASLYFSGFSCVKKHQTHGTWSSQHHGLRQASSR